MDIFFIENPYQAKRVNKFIKKSKIKDYRLVSLFPEATYYLDEKKYSYIILDDFHIPLDLQRLGSDNFDLMKKFFEFVNQNFREFASFKNYDISLDYFQDFHVKVLFDAVCLRIYEIDKFFSTFNPENVYIFKTIKEKIDDTLFFTYESLYSEVIKLVCLQRKIKVHIFDNPFLKLNLVYKKIMLIYNNFFNNFKSIIKYFLSLKIKRQVNNLKENIIFLNLGYDLKYLAEDLQEKYNVIYWNVYYNPLSIKSISKGKTYKFKFHFKSNKLKSELEKFYRELIKKDEFSQFFIYKNINFFHVIENRIKYLLIDNIIQCVRIYKMSEMICEKFKPICILTHSNYDYKSKLIFQVCKKKKIKTIVYQHGWYGVTCHKLVLFIDMAENDYFLIYGEGVKQAIEESKLQNIRAKPKLTGSAQIDAIFPEKNKNLLIRKKLNIPLEKKIVIYITNLIERYRLYLENIDYPDNTFFNIQKNIVLGFRDFPDIQFIYRPFRSNLPQTPIEKIIKKEIKNCIIANIPYDNLIQIGDIFIFDYPSTGLFKTLKLQKPHIVYYNSKYYRFRPQAKKLLEKTCFLTDNLNQIPEILKNILNEKTAIPYDDEFLKKYATHLNDGNSVKRAIEVLEEK